MYLGDVTGARSRPIWIPASNIDARVLSKEEMDELVNKLKEVKEDKEIEEKIFNGFFKFAIYIAGQYALHVPRLAKDLASEALLTLVVAIKKIPEKLEDTNIKPYIARKIHGRLCAFLYKEQQKRKPIVNNQLAQDMLKIKSYKGFYRDKARHMMEEIRGMVKDERESVVVEMRSQGYDDIEIGKELNISARLVFSIRKRIEKRYFRSTQ